MARPRKYSKQHLEAAAKRYEVSERTIIRWIEAGVNISDVEAVATHLLRQRAPKQAAMLAAHEQLTEQ